MSHKLTEEQVLDKLNVSDFRHVTKDKIVEICSMLPEMDPEVAKKAIEQFPNFSDMAKGMASVYRDLANDILSQNAQGNQAFYASCNRILDRLDEQLSHKFLLPSQKTKITEQMIEVANMIAKKDSENKEFLNNQSNRNTGVITGILLTAAALLGFKIWKK